MTEATLLKRDMLTTVRIELLVIDLMGQTVYTQNVEITEGYNMVTIPVKQFNAGVYMVTMRTNTGISTQKLIVK